MSPLDLPVFRSRAEAFLAGLDKEHYLHFSGQKDDYDASSIYAQYPELFSRRTLDDLRVHYAAIKDPWEKKQCANLLTWVIESHVDEQLTDITDRIANAEGRALVKVDGEEIGFRYASVVIANESDRARRQRIHEARLRTLETELNPLHDQYWRRAHDIAVGLGYASYEELFGEIKAMNHGLFSGEVQLFVQETTPVYERQLDNLVQARLGLTLEELQVWDFPFLFRAPEYDRYFTAERLVPTLHDTLAGLGIDLRKQDNVHLDTEARANKSPRAFCAPVRIPDEIYLSVMPMGGQDDYQALLHESGHAEHMAHIKPDLEFEYRCLGDIAVTEGFAFLFDHLPLNPLWLQHYLGYEDAADYIRFAYVSELYMVRRYAAKFVYELDLHQQPGSLDGMAQRYSDTLAEAIGVPIPPQNYLADVDAGFYVCSYLRAWFFEAGVRLVLQSQFGKDWFRNPEAGDWLRWAWGMGQKFNSPQLYLKLGGGKLDADPLRFVIEGVLGR